MPKVKFIAATPLLSGLVVTSSVSQIASQETCAHMSLAFRPGEKNVQACFDTTPK